MRGPLFQLAFVVWTLAVGLAMVPAAPFTDAAGTRAWARRWQGGILWLLRVVCGIRVEVRGTPPREPSLLASKHQSVLETLVFHRLVPDIAIPLKQELTRIPILGHFLLKSGCIAVARDAGPRAMRALIEAARQRTASGLSLLIFPEGTRVLPGEQRPYRPGIAALYLQLARPVVPIALHTGHVWGKGIFAKHPGTAVIEFLDPIPPGLDRKAFMARLEHDIEVASARLAGGEALPAQSRGRSPASGLRP